MAVRRPHLFALDDPDPREMTIIEHLEELRQRLIVSFAAVAVASTIGFFLGARWLLGVLLIPIHHHYGHFVTLAPTGAFGIELKMAIVIGLAISVPVWLYELWMFVVPAIDLTIRRYMVPFILLGLALFASGIYLGYRVVPLALNFLIGMGGTLVTYIPEVNSYVTQIGFVMLLFGIIFELPIVLALLARIGIVSSAMLRRRRRFGYFTAVGAALIVTPGTDPVTPLILGVVLVILYEFSIVLIRLIHR